MRAVNARLGYAPLPDELRCADRSFGVHHEPVTATS